jgi:TatD DNase family protein
VAIELFDTHAHLDDPQFASDLSEVLERAKKAGVANIVTIATTAESSRSALELARTYPGLAATVGIQPNCVAAASPEDWDLITAWAHAGGTVALGETGLDRHWHDTPFDQQEDYFARHLSLARELALPVVIHCREAEADVLRMLRQDFERHGPVRGVMHSFTGTAETASACIAMGLYISFAGMVTYKNASDLRQVARTVPGDRIVIETDSPYLAPVPHRGKRNEPANVRFTLECLARERNEDVDFLARQTRFNARQLFFSPVPPGEGSGVRGDP